VRELTNRWLAIVAVTAVVVGMAACSPAPRASVEEAAESVAAHAETGEHATPAESSEHASTAGAGEHARSERGGEHGEGGEHSEGGEHALGEEGEESGEYIGRNETWDATRRGARLVLSFDPATNAFRGTVENTTQQMICAVRVEVHLSTGTELGPTERTDLPAGEKTEVRLPTGGEAFDSWTAHPEASPCSGG
jgi:hypothetical protein